MTKYLVVTIDVEPDCTPSWRYANPLTFAGVSTGIREYLQPLFQQYNIIPTYLINNVVLEDEKSCDVLRNLSGSYELGTHLHPEFIEPLKKFDLYAGKKAEANCCFYPHDIEYMKIKNITDLFTRNFGYNPVTFRAGRFSAGPNTIDSLAKLGYRVDTSVTPHVVWEDSSREMPVDFSSAPDQPYFIKPGSISEEDHNGSILQVPVSITTKKASIFSELKETRFGMRRSIRSTRPMWLRPVFSSAKECIQLAEEFCAKYQDKDVLILNMMFHNVEIMPGLSPYTKSKKDCENYLHQLEEFFIYCGDTNIHGAKLSSIYDFYRK
ncbi:MAG TPA: hypothetical protein VMI12_09970 [Puia sp.]|nr:hypothetical protein [Puia sp.]